MFEKNAIFDFSRFEENEDKPFYEGWIYVKDYLVINKLLYLSYKDMISFPYEDDNPFELSILITDGNKRNISEYVEEELFNDEEELSDHKTIYANLKVTKQLDDSYRQLLEISHNLDSFINDAPEIESFSNVKRVLHGQKEVSSEQWLEEAFKDNNVFAINRSSNFIRFYHNNKTLFITSLDDFDKNNLSVAVYVKFNKKSDAIDLFDKSNIKIMDEIPEDVEDNLEEPLNIVTGDLPDWYQDYSYEDEEEVGDIQFNDYYVNISDNASVARIDSYTGEELWVNTPEDFGNEIILTTNPDGDVLAIDENNNAIMYDREGEILDRDLSLLEDIQFDQIQFANNNTFYAPSASNNVLYKVTLENGNTVTEIINDELPDGPEFFSRLSEEYIYLANGTSLYQIEIETGDILLQLPYNYFALAAEPNGDFYISIESESSFEPGEILKLDKEGSLIWRNTLPDIRGSGFNVLGGISVDTYFVYCTGLQREAIIYEKTTGTTVRRINYNNLNSDISNFDLIFFTDVDFKGNFYIAFPEQGRVLVYHRNGSFNMYDDPEEIAWIAAGNGKYGAGNWESDFDITLIESDELTFYTGSKDGILSNFDSNGNLIWDYSENQEPIKSIVVANDNHLYALNDNDELLKLDTEGNLQWTVELQGISTVDTRRIEVDSDENVYVATHDFSVVKLSSSGNVVWEFTNAHSETIQEVVLDSNSNVYSCSSDGTILKLDNDGNEIIRHDIEQAVNNIEVDPEGNIYYSTNDSIVAIDENGDEIWELPLGVPTESSVINDDLLYIGVNAVEFQLVVVLAVRITDGEFATEIPLDETGEDSLRTFDVSLDGDVIAYLVESQEIQKWTFEAGEPAEMLWSISVDDINNIKAIPGHNSTGVRRDFIVIDPVEDTDEDPEFEESDSGVEIFVMYEDNNLSRLNSNGSFLWTKGFNEDVNEFVIDDDNNSYIAGENVTKLDSEGEVVWENDTLDSTDHIAIDIDGNLFVTGHNVIYKLNNDGVEQWSYTDIETGDTEATRYTSITVDQDGYVYATHYLNTEESGRIIKLNSDNGSVEWIEPYSDTDYQKIETDVFGYVYLIDYLGYFKKISPDNELLFEQSLSNDPLLDITIDDEQVYIVGENGLYVRRLSGAIVREDSNIHSENVASVAVTQEGNLYTSSTDGELKLTDSEGDTLESNISNPEFIFDINVVDIEVSPGKVGAGFWNIEPEFIEDGYYSYIGSTDDTVIKLDFEGYALWEYTGHSDRVQTVAVNNDGNVYSGSFDNSIRKLDSDGNEVWAFTGHTAVIESIAVDTNGNVYSASRDNTVRKIDSDGNEVWTFTGHNGNVYTVSLDLFGNVYSAGSNNIIRKVDSDANELWSFTGHDNSIFSIANDSQNNVYSLGTDNTLRKIDNNGNELWSTSLTIFDVDSIIVGENDEPILTSASDESIKKFDTDGNEVWSLNIDFPPRSIAQDKDDFLYVGGTNSNAIKIDRNGDVIWNYDGFEFSRTVNGFAVDPGVYPIFWLEPIAEVNIYTGGDDAVVRSLDEDGNIIWEYDEYEPFDDAIQSLARDYNGDLYVGSADTTVRKLSMFGDEIWRFTDHQGTVNALISDKNNNIITGADDGTLRKLDSNGNEIWVYTEQDNIFDLDIDAFDNVYSASFEGTVHKIDSNGNNIWEYDGLPDQAFSVAIDNDGNVYTASNDSVVVKLDMDGEEVWTYSGHTADAFGTFNHPIAVDKDGFIYSGGSDGELHKLDSNGDLIWVFDGHQLAIHSVEVDEDGFIYTGSIDEFVYKLDEDGDTIWSFSGHQGGIYAIAADPFIKDRYEVGPFNIYSSSFDNSVRRFDSQGNQVWVSVQNDAVVTDTAVDTQGYIFTSSNDNTVHKLNPENGLSIWSYTDHSGNVEKVSTDSNDNVYSASRDNTVRKLDNDGNEIWIFTEFSTWVEQLEVDNENNIIAIDSNQNIKKIDSDGNEVWSSNITGSANDLAISDDNYIYICNFGGDVIKYDSDGDQQLVFEANNNIALSVGVDSDGNIFCGGTDEILRKFDSEGDEIWSYTSFSNDVSSIETNVNGEVYAGSEDGEIKKIDSDGNMIWENENHTGHITSLSSILLSDDPEFVPELNFYTATGGTISGFGVTKHDGFNNPQWTFSDYSEQVSSVTVDSDGYVYTGSNDNTVKKIDSDGNEIWVYTGHNSRVNDVAVDSEGNVYSVGNNIELHKTNSDGEEEWIFTGHGGRNAYLNVVVVDSNDDTYSAGREDVVRKVNSIGVEQWVFTDHSATIEDLAVDQDGSVYTASQDGTVKKINTTGNSDWTFSTEGNIVRAVAVDKDKNIYYSDNGSNFVKLDEDGNEIWAKTNFSLQVIEYANDGYLYVRGGNNLMKVNTDGEIVWQYQPHGTTGYNDIALEPGAFPVFWQ